MSAENKTQPNAQDVEQFLNAITDESKRKDCLVIMDIMAKITGEKPKMWGESMVGFGSYHYKYASGREGDWFITGFSPRKSNITIYLAPDFGYTALTEIRNLGKYKIGKSCLYISKIADIKLEILEKLLQDAVTFMKNER